MSTQILPIKLEPIQEKLAKFYETVPEELHAPFGEVLVPYLKSIEIMLEELPRIIKGTTNADNAMKAITTIPTVEEAENAKDLLGKIAKSYEVNHERRERITKPGDALKEFVMGFENIVSTDSKKDNGYNRIKGLLQSFQQEKLNEKRRQEAAAAKKKERDDHKVALELQIGKNLSTLLVAKVKQADEGSAGYFTKLTVETFDVEAEKFKNWKPKLKPEDYEKCFQVSYSKHLLEEDEFLILVNECKGKETYDKWNALIVEQTQPIVDAWKEKIPALKAEKEAIANAKSEEEKKRLEEEQRQKEAREKREREEALAVKQREIDEANEREASLKTMENTFVEQASVQQLEDAGLVKTSIRFTDVKEIPMAMGKIMFQCMTHKDFYGIYQLDAQKKQKLDAAGRPEYAPGIKWWLTQFQALKIDVKIQGIEVVEDSKIIIKK